MDEGLWHLEGLILIDPVLLLLLSCFSRVRLCASPQTAAHQALTSLGFSRQEHWSGLPFPSPMHESEKWKWSRSAVSDSSRPHGLQSTRLLCPWDSPGMSTGVGCHCLFQTQLYLRVIALFQNLALHLGPLLFLHIQVVLGCWLLKPNSPENK